MPIDRLSRIAIFYLQVIVKNSFHNVIEKYGNPKLLAALSSLS